jgi:hypothetical protein
MKFIIILMIFLFILLFLLIFYIINIFLKKNLEFFDKAANGLLCGTRNDVCNINQKGVSNCCNGYTCIRQNGIFENKVCIENSYVKTIKDEGSVNNDFLNFFKNFFLFGSKINNNKTFCEEEDLEIKLKDLCNNPYKLNLDGLLSFCKIKLPFFHESEEENNVIYSQGYNDRKNCLI